MPTRQTTGDTWIESARIGPGDPRYLGVADKRFNKRFRASPGYVRLVSSTAQVVSAVEEAVRDDFAAVRSAGSSPQRGART